MTLFYLLAILFTFFAIYSWLKIKNGEKIAKFVYSWAFFIGSFVWEDLFIFSIYGLVASIATIFLGHWKFGLLFYIVFWLVRSAGETLYFFLQQFIEPKQYPHYIDSHFGLIRAIFGKISYQQCLIVMQVFFQVILMTSIVALITILFAWNRF